MSAKEGGEVLAELYLMDHRHGEERPFVLRLTPGYLTLMPVEEAENGKSAPRQGLVARLRSRFGAPGPMTPHPLMETDFRLDDSGVRIRMGSNAVYSYHDFSPPEARKFLVAYLNAKREAR